MLINTNKYILQAVFNLIIKSIINPWPLFSLNDLGRYLVVLRFIVKLHLEKVLGFIRRSNSWKFNNPKCIKLLCCSLVHSILKYCFVVWNSVKDFGWKNFWKYSMQYKIVYFIAPKFGLPTNDLFCYFKNCYSWPVI